MGYSGCRQLLLVRPLSAALLTPAQQGSKQLLMLPAGFCDFCLYRCFVVNTCFSVGCTGCWRQAWQPAKLDPAYIHSLLVLLVLLVVSITLLAAVPEHACVLLYVCICCSY